MQNDGSVFAYGERARYSSSAPDATPCISTLRMPACGRPVLAGAVLTLTNLRCSATTRVCRSYAGHGGNGGDGGWIGQFSSTTQLGSSSTGRTLSRYDSILLRWSAAQLLQHAATIGLPPVHAAAGLLSIVALLCTHVFLRHAYKHPVQSRPVAVNSFRSVSSIDRL